MSLNETGSTCVLYGRTRRFVSNFYFCAQICLKGNRRQIFIIDGKQHRKSYEPNLNYTFFASTNLNNTCALLSEIFPRQHHRIIVLTQKLRQKLTMSKGSHALYWKWLSAVSKNNTNSTLFQFSQLQKLYQHSLTLLNFIFIK